MAISILHLNERISNAEALSDRILYHLSLDRSFSHICADVNKREYFLSVLSDLTDDKNEILYRQDIVKDFEIINGRYGAMTRHKYDHGSIRVSCSIYMEIMAVDRYQFSVTV